MSNTNNADFTPNLKNQENYINIAYLKMCELPDFPFIADDFDALTTYQKLCKIAGYVDKVIKNLEIMETNMANTNENVQMLLTAFNQLQDYVNHWFDSLDIQAEVNAKLQAMLDSGELASLINLFLNYGVFKTYNTYEGVVGLREDLANLTVGQKVQTLGYNEISDGGGAKYYVTDSEDITKYQVLIPQTNRYLTYIYPDANFKEMPAEVFGLGATNDISFIFDLPYFNEVCDKLVLNKDVTYLIVPNSMTRSNALLINETIEGNGAKLVIDNTNAKALKFENCNVNKLRLLSNDSSNRNIDVIILEGNNGFNECTFEINSTNATPDLITLIKQNKGMNVFENCFFKCTGSDNTAILFNVYQNQDTTKEYRLFINTCEFIGGKDAIYFEPQTDYSKYSTNINNCDFQNQTQYIANINSEYNIIRNATSNSTRNAKELINNTKQNNIIQILSKSLTEAYYNNQTKIYKTVAEMQSSNDIQVGDKVQTLGYYTENDGGNAEYIITNTQSTTEYQETLTNGLYATLISNTTINVQKCGAKTNGVDDCYSIINSIISLNKYKTLYFPAGKYLINTAVNIQDKIKTIVGDNSNNTEIIAQNGFITFTNIEYLKINNLHINGVNKSSIAINGAFAFSKLENLIIEKFETCIKSLDGTWINELTNIFFKDSVNGYYHYQSGNCNNMIFRNCTYQHISNICNYIEGFNIEFSGCDIEFSNICFQKLGRIYNINDCYIEGNNIIINNVGAFFESDVTINNSWLTPSSSAQNGWLINSSVFANVDAKTASVCISNCIINNITPDTLKPFAFIANPDGNKTYIGISLFKNYYFNVKTSDIYNITYDDLFDTTNCPNYGQPVNNTTFSSDLPLYKFNNIRWYREDDGNVKGFGSTQTKIKMVGTYDVTSTGTVTITPTKYYGNIAPEVNNIIVSVIYTDDTIELTKMKVDSRNFYVYCNPAKTTKKIIFNNIMYYKNF